MTEGQINVSVANVYRDPSYGNEIVTQGLLGEDITVLEKKDSFSRIRLPDNYEGWISNYQWVDRTQRSGEFVLIRSHTALIKIEPQPQSETLRDATIGVRLYIKRRENSWIQVFLPDGILGWIESRHTGVFPEVSGTMIETIACEFLGYPYFWGGRSPKGFDCSGFTQTVFSLLGVKLPRDSWMQQESTRFVSRDFRDAQKGDLYFFSETGKRITHVGIALGGGKLIHARGMVRINNLDSTKPDFSPELLRDLVDVRRVREEMKSG